MCHMTISAVLDYPATKDGKIRLMLDAPSGSPAGRQLAVLLHNLSPSGVLIESDHALVLGDPIETAFSEQQIVLGKISWTSTRLYGCQFEQDVGAALIERTMVSALHEDAGVAVQSDPAESFGAMLQRLRIAKGLHQAEIAEKLGVSAVAISNWEADRSQPRRHRIAELAMALGVPSQQLVLNSVAIPESLPEVLASSRAQVARLLGINSANVKISVNVDL